MVVMPDDEIDAVIAISDEAMNRKIAAIEAHITQIDFYRSLNDKFDYSSVVRPEHFMLSASRLPALESVEDDLFSGIRTEAQR
jgi:LmbE family N-acetylglucosaminyl deacetylase